MSYKDYQKSIEVTLCQACPARRGEIFLARLRGSSFRGRLIDDREEFTVDNCLFFVGKVVIANVQIANLDRASAEQDAEVITSSFEANARQCIGPDTVSGDAGLQTFCAPINCAVDEFISLNYTVEQ